MEQHPLNRGATISVKRGATTSAKRGEATSAKNGVTSFEKGLLLISCNNIEK